MDQGRVRKRVAVGEVVGVAAEQRDRPGELDVPFSANAEVDASGNVDGV